MTHNAIYKIKIIGELLCNGLWELKYDNIIDIKS